MGIVLRLKWMRELKKKSATEACERREDRQNYSANRINSGNKNVNNVGVTCKHYRISENVYTNLLIHFNGVI